jgi:hypothetical protein
MRHYHLTRNSYHCPVLNLDKLWTLVPEEQRKGLTASSTEVPVIDVLAAGYSKVLGKGRLPQLPCIVKARWVSELAEKKIKEAGGVVQVSLSLVELSHHLLICPSLYSLWLRNFFLCTKSTLSYTHVTFLHSYC